MIYVAFTPQHCTGSANFIDAATSGTLYVLKLYIGLNGDESLAYSNTVFSSYSSSGRPPS